MLLIWGMDKTEANRKRIVEVIYALRYVNTGAQRTALIEEYAALAGITVDIAHGAFEWDGKLPLLP